MSTNPIASSQSTDSPYSEAFSASDLMPVKARGYDPAQGLPVDNFSSDRPVFKANQTPAVLLPRPQNANISAPYNPATDVFETSTVKAGDISFSTRYNNGGLLTQPADKGTQPLTPAGLGVNPVRVDATIPVVRDAVFSLDLKARLDSNQNSRVGPEAGLNLGDLKVTAGIYQNEPVQSILQNDARARTEVSGAATLKLSDEMSIGVSVLHFSGGTARQSGTTRIDPSLTLTVDGTQIQGGPTFTLDDKQGNTQVGGLLTVQPAKPDNTRPYGFAVVKYGDNPLTENSTSFSVNGGIRF